MWWKFLVNYRLLLIIWIRPFWRKHHDCLSPQPSFKVVVPKTGYHCPGAPAWWTLQIYQTGVALVWLHHVIAQLGTTDEGQPRLRYGQNKRGRLPFTTLPSTRYTWMGITNPPLTCMNSMDICGIGVVNVTPMGESRSAKSTTPPHTIYGLRRWNLDAPWMQPVT